MRRFKSVNGGRVAHNGPASRTWQAVHEAQVRGFLIGRRVRIGRVRGTLIGYNIAGRGRFHGANYPLLVQTAYGVAKCSLDETELA